MNQTRGSLIKNLLMVTLGMFPLSFGVYITIQAGIGVSPWDALALGLARTFGISYGTGNILIGLTVVVLDLLLREPIGPGTIVNAILLGKLVDLFRWLDWIPPQESWLTGIPMIIAGWFLVGFGQYLYMRPALGSGPRDSLMVALKRRIRRIPIGIISVMILVTVAFLGWLLGGSIGIGTLISVCLAGPIMQLVFRWVAFDATAVRHQDILTSVRVLLKGKMSETDR
ncbi:MAG: hypothetical protein HFF11_09775 [Angelakisella sp.]|jgi:uncharacterized membrane protein YczE|nr:hypothetical protein [Angelakisella sp.]